jgi:hypothetical protein
MVVHACQVTMRFSVTLTAINVISTTVRHVLRQIVWIVAKIEPQLKIIAHASRASLMADNLVVKNVRIISVVLAMSSNA